MHFIGQFVLGSYINGLLDVTSHQVILRNYIFIIYTCEYMKIYSYQYIYMIRLTPSVASNKPYKYILAGEYVDFFS